MRTWFALLQLLVLSSITVTSAFARSEIHKTGSWPFDWPEELEAFRERAVTDIFEAGARFKTYLIPVYSVEELRSVWPALLRVQTQGRPVEFGSIGSIDPRYDLELDGAIAVVAIRAPYDEWVGDIPARDNKGKVISRARWDLYGKWLVGEQLTDADSRELDIESLAEMNGEDKLTRQFANEGRSLYAGAPWPEYLYDPQRSLPEYVRYVEEDGKFLWTEGKPNDGQGFLFRTWVECVVHLDDKAVDVSELALPIDSGMTENR